MKRLENRVAFITGGARGMGRLIAIKFAAEGANIVLTDIADSLKSVPYSLSSGSQLKKTVAEVEEQGVSAFAVMADVRMADQMESAVDKTLERYGKIDILVANAGILSYGNIWELSEETWDQMIDVNLKGTWLACKFVVPHMISERYGKIICMSSVYGHRGGAKVSHYVASKHGVLGLVKSLAMEVGPYNIHVNAICPTAVDTDMANNQATYDRLAGKAGATREEATPAFGGHHVFPDEGFIPGEDIANAALFLASDESRNVTGHHLAVDAGYLAV
jgi:SDR family mycofactocin-dependent oxidoreductase